MAPPAFERPHIPPARGRVEERAAGGWRAGLPVGTRVALVLSILLLIAAAYLTFSPLELPTPQGPPFRCGTAASRPHDAFSRNSCGEINTRRALAAAAVLMSALVVAGGGFFVFGVRSRRPTASGPAAG